MRKVITLSTMRELVVPSCVVGQMVRYTGDMANSPGTGAVVAIRPGSLWKFKQSGGCDVEREIRAALAKHTYCVGR